MTRRIVPLLLVLVVGCGPSLRDKTLKATFLSVRAAGDGFLAWSREHEAQLIEKATSREEVKAKVQAFRDRADRTIVAALAVAYSALAAALIDKDTPLPRVIAAAQQLYDAIAALKKESP